MVAIAPSDQPTPESEPESIEVTGYVLAWATDGQWHVHESILSKEQAVVEMAMLDHSAQQSAILLVVGATVPMAQIKETIIQKKLAILNQQQTEINAIFKTISEQN